jgi:hypothetical protein
MAFVLARKLRETVTAASIALPIGGDGRAVEADRAYFGGHRRREILAADRVGRYPVRPTPDWLGHA